MYEHKHQPLLPRAKFVSRLLRSVGLSAAIVFTGLAIGILGYHEIAGLAWIDALVDASMILSGMGPVSPLTTAAGKIFASAYALFSGIVFVAIAALVIAPLLHRMLHHFHLEARK
jgi:hypothetical protein